MKLQTILEKEKLPSVKTPSVEEIAKKHNVSKEKIEKQLTRGIEVEYEHAKDKATSREIALDHLAEIPDYYDRLDKMEKKAGVKEH